MKHICTECQQPIAAGDAVLRSVAFKLTAWHRECYAFAMLPAQRTSVESSPTPPYK